MHTRDLSRIRHRILAEPRRVEDDVAYVAGVDHALMVLRRHMLEELRQIDQEQARDAAGTAVPAPRRTPRMI